jgi:hypothetical protein
MCKRKTHFDQSDLSNKSVSAKTTSLPNLGVLVAISGVKKKRKRERKKKKRGNSVFHLMFSYHIQSFVTEDKAMDAYQGGDQENIKGE